MPEVKPIIEVTEEELREREAREKEYLARKEDLEKRAKLLEEEKDRLVKLAKMSSVYPNEALKMIEEVSSLDFKSIIKNYDGELFTKVGNWKTIDKGKFTKYAEFYSNALKIDLTRWQEEIWKKHQRKHRRKSKN